MITAYLTFDGNTEKAFEFYKSVFGGEFTNFQRFGDMPHGENMADEDKHKIMHVTLKSSRGTLMGNDHMAFMGSYSTGNNFSLSVHPDNIEEATELFNKLSAEGNILMPFEKVFWGGYFGMLADKFGVKWLVNCEAA